MSERHRDIFVTKVVVTHRPLCAETQGSQTIPRLPGVDRSNSHVLISSNNFTFRPFNVFQWRI